MEGPIPLASWAQAALTFQTYGSQPEIADVALLPLAKHRANNGWFMEWLRVTGGSVQGLPDDWRLRQVSVSYGAPGRVNAFHIHPRLPQSELWTVVQGQILVWLVDCRADSATCGARRRLTLTAEEPAVLGIPPGVAHGYKAGADGALLLYALDQQFDAADPNEGRLPWDLFGSGLWEEDRG